MILFYLVVGVFVVLLIGTVAEWMLYRQGKSRLPSGSTWGTLYHNSMSWFDGLRQRGDDLLTPSYLPDTDAFKSWIKQELNDHPRLCEWLLSSPEEGFKALTRQLAEFCQELSIDLTWLVNGDLKREPELEQVAREVVIAYCDACLKAIKIQTELAAFGKYQANLDRLAQPRNREASQRLLERLRAHQLAPPAEPDIMLASEYERYQYVLSTLRQASLKDPETFDKLVAEIDQRNHAGQPQ